MGFTSHRRLVARSSSSSWHGTATIVEALLLLVFLLAAIALMTKTLSLSYAKADEGTQLSAAAMAASNTAELFAADPTDKGLAMRSQDALTVTCKVTPEKTGAGTLYRAVICVYGQNSAGSVSGSAASDSSGANQEPLYRLTTSRYVGEVS